MCNKKVGNQEQNWNFKVNWLVFPSVLWCSWLGVKKDIWLLKTCYAAAIPKGSLTLNGSGKLGNAYKPVNYKTEIVVPCTFCCTLLFINMACTSLSSSLLVLLPHVVYVCEPLCTVLCLQAWAVWWSLLEYLSTSYAFSGKTSQRASHELFVCFTYFAGLSLSLSLPSACNFAFIGFVDTRLISYVYWFFYTFMLYSL